MGDVAPAVDEVVGFLHHFAPRALSTLQAAHPADSSLLEPGQLAGPREQDTPLRVEVALIGLDEAIKVCATTLPMLRARLARSQFWLFIGQLLSMIGGASILATLALDAGKVATYTAGVLALLGSAATLFGQHLDGTLHPTNGKLVDIYRELADHSVEAAQTRSVISVAIAADCASDALESVPRANDLCLQMGKLMNRIV